MHNFKKLNIWLDAMTLAKEVYMVTSRYPREEKYGLVSQINRCVVSVPSNISEGSSRSSNKKFSHYLKIALGSLYELETQTILSRDFGIITDDEFYQLSINIATLQRMINGFINSIK